MTSGRTTLAVMLALSAGTTALRGIVGTAGMDRATMRLKSEFDFGFEQGHIAGHLARGDGYSVRFGDAAPIPSAWASPLYPLLLAGIFRIWGVYTFDAQIAVIWFNAACHGAIAAMLYLLGKRIAHGAARLGLTAVALFLFLPSGWQFLHWAWCIHLLAALILLHLCILTGPWRSPAAQAAWAGATLGLALLADGAAVMIVPLSLLTVWRVPSSEFRVPGSEFRASRCVAFLFACLLVLAPWTIRNGLTLGSWSPLRGMTGAALWMGNHPGAAAEDYHGLRENPWHNPDAARRFVTLGERGFDADCRERFVAATRANPMRFVHNCWMRFTGFWFGEWWLGWSAYPRVYAAGLIATTLLAWLGLIAAWRRGWPVGAYAGVMLLFPLPYYATFLSYGRYRYPIEPILCLMAAALLTCRGRRSRVQF